MEKIRIEGAADKGDALRAEVNALEKPGRQLKVEYDILIKASEILKKDGGVNPQALSN